MMPKTVTYQIIWRELVDLDKRVKDLGRLAKDKELGSFVQRWDRFFMTGIGPRGIPAIEIDRNMLNFLARTYALDGDTLKQRITRIFEEFVQRHYGNPRTDDATAA